MMPRRAGVSRPAGEKTTEARYNRDTGKRRNVVFAARHVAFAQDFRAENPEAAGVIVKVIPHAKAGSERVQMEYAIEFKREHVVDLRNVHGSERQGAYALDLKNGGEKVEWTRTVNTGVDNPRWAIRAIELHNARNIPVWSPNLGSHSTGSKIRLNQPKVVVKTAS